ncbi:MAG: HAD-IA family hydrolase [Acholeplasmatales bacterium]|nr:HAD-IA family hydrolase [Acholeplasmatales bacterium]
MNNDIALIWDLDGTLIDSYAVIVDGVYRVCKEYGIDVDIEKIKKEVILYSVSYYLNKIEIGKKAPFDEIKNRYSKITEENNDKIIPMKNSLELLDKLKKLGIKNYVFTHRGLSTDFVLHNINMYDYFDEIITSKSGFKRKPDPEGINYFVNKYHLDKNKTYYVGDRTLDMECANNAGVKSILYLPVGGITPITGKETYVVKDLLEILDKLNIN